jgi:hypothetical protein
VVFPLHILQQNSCMSPTSAACLHVTLLVPSISKILHCSCICYLTEKCPYIGRCITVCLYTKIYMPSPSVLSTSNGKLSIDFVRMPCYCFICFNKITFKKFRIFQKSISQNYRIIQYAKRPSKLRNSNNCNTSVIYDTKLKSTEVRSAVVA